MNQIQGTRGWEWRLDGNSKAGEKKQMLHSGQWKVFQPIGKNFALYYTDSRKYLITMENSGSI